MRTTSEHFVCMREFSLGLRTCRKSYSSPYTCHVSVLVVCMLNAVRALPATQIAIVSV